MTSVPNTIPIARTTHTPNPSPKASTTKPSWLPTTSDGMHPLASKIEDPIVQPNIPTKAFIMVS